MSEEKVERQQSETGEAKKGSSGRGGACLSISCSSTTVLVFLVLFLLGWFTVPGFAATAWYWLTRPFVWTLAFFTWLGVGVILVLVGVGIFKLYQLASWNIRARRFEFYSEWKQAKKDLAVSMKDYYSFGLGKTPSQNQQSLSRYRSAQKRFEDLDAKLAYYLDEPQRKKRELEQLEQRSALEAIDKRLTPP